MEYGTAVVLGIPLIAVVMAAVEWLKSVGVEGKASLVASLVIGLLLGVGYQVSLGMPTDFAGWFGKFVYGLGLGLTASGLYNVGDNLVAKNVAALKKPQQNG